MCLVGFMPNPPSTTSCIPTIVEEAIVEEAMVGSAGGTATTTAAPTAADFFSPGGIACSAIIRSATAGCLSTKLADQSDSVQYRLNHYTDCGRTWGDECGAVDGGSVPAGFTATSTYSVFCPSSPCWTGDTWLNLNPEEHAYLKQNKFTKNGSPVVAAVMLQVSTKNTDGNMAAAVSGGLACLAIGAVLMVKLAERRRRASYSKLPTPV
jgi:hypothetical protein